MADAGIVDEDIEPTFGSSYLLYRGSNLGFFGDIKLLRACTPSGGANFTGNLLYGIYSDIGENDVRTLLRKEPCDLLSDARPGPCYERDFLIQAKHPYFLSSL